MLLGIPFVPSFMIISLVLFRNVSTIHMMLSNFKLDSCEHVVFFCFFFFISVLLNYIKIFQYVDVYIEKVFVSVLKLCYTV